ncbi:hypothetical protein OEZ86_010189 [Tetradesmus obliquus]|nr:hypothetical protein OEZ86_010189 [Tetradesmus obliquus]
MVQELRARVGGAQDPAFAAALPVQMFENSVQVHKESAQQQQQQQQQRRQRGAAAGASDDDSDYTAAAEEEDSADHELSDEYLYDDDEDCPPRSATQPPRGSSAAAAGNAAPAGGNGRQQQAKQQRWSDEEHAQLVALVARYGQSNWNVLAEHLHGRNGRQCYERFHMCRDKTKRGNWTLTEDFRLATLHSRLGNK